MTDEVWILGATGRTGRAVAQRLADAGIAPVLVGRDSARLAQMASDIGDARTVSGLFEQVLAQVRTQAPRVVINTIGPFTRTSMPVLSACPPGTEYVDISNELAAVEAVLNRHDDAAAAGQTMVTGAGFGVLATESAVLRVCAGRPAPARVRVEAIPSVALQAGVMGEALAATIMDSMPGGGRRVQDGRLVRSAVANEVRHVTTPDGDAVTTAAFPSGDLIAAWRASGAAEVRSASSEMPSGVAVRLALPALVMLMRPVAVRRLATRQLARMKLRARERPRPFSWGHARAEWGDGTVREAWLRAEDAMDFTAATAADVALRLCRGAGKPGAYTPGALFGAGLAIDVGAEFVS